MAIEFADRIRGQIKFASAGELVDQMHTDVAAAREITRR